MEALSEELKIKKLEGGSIVTPRGFSAAGVHAGLRYAKKDVGMIASNVPASSAAVYTLNTFQAAPIIVTKDSLAADGMLQGVVVNSACANACTGQKGLMDAYEMRKKAAEKLGIDDTLFAVASTGVIGEYLPLDKILTGIDSLELSEELQSAEDFQTAILTTDTGMKGCCFQADIDGVTVFMGGAAKGSGMIHPNMATMLGFITTDVNISPADLQIALRQVTNHTFNQITVDGDTSTNDMVLVMANGEANNQTLTQEHPEWDTFIELLTSTCESLAKQIAKDGEGATKLVEVLVKGAENDEDARKVAKQIVGSNLVKTAIFGSDANWGRIICAIGNSQAKVNPENVNISIGPIVMLKSSVPQPFSEDDAKNYLENEFIQIFVDLQNGEGKSKAWGCDLSYDYVKINASYRT
ncbi:bifunctional ornithine acetyltransferase/N-acetylglutamate synthase [Bacillus massilinigeriensis]|uniref:bifunctional ornithine acetyltransferase/N-acetylglutamate synthase n=1 Tax=Bacillus massilionigeriensis TaxID=1805475 RepID=UPI00096B2366|nr:bifunctional ornithine acetyltransferase/N-acetylglutamate synthase [Bacillus massilionigeriensis]